MLSAASRVDSFDVEHDNVPVNACSCGAGDTASLVSQLVQEGTIALKLVPRSGVTDLTEDIVVKAGSVVFLDGQGRTLKTGAYQFRVEAGAKLCLYNLILVDGTKSAVHIANSTAPRADGTSAGMHVCGPP